MFFKLTLTKIVTALPRDLGPAVNRSLEGLLRDAVEGTIIPNVGLVLGVLDIVHPHLLEGKVLDNGNVQFRLKYVALVYRLFTDEVVDARVIEITKAGFMATTGCARCYVSHSSMPVDYLFEGDGMHNAFVKRDGSKAVRDGDIVRIKLCAAEVEKLEDMSLQADGGSYIATMDGEYLGPR